MVEKFNFSIIANEVCYIIDCLAIYIIVDKVNYIMSREAKHIIPSTIPNSKDNEFRKKKNI